MTDNIVTICIALFVVIAMSLSIKYHISFKRQLNNETAELRAQEYQDGQLEG